MHGHDDDHFDGDFHNDIKTILTRRRLLIGAGALSVTGAALWAQGGPGRPAPMQPSPEVLGTGADGQTCVGAPAETNGPFPADGTNTRDGQTVNALTLAGVIRPDITFSIAGLSGVADGFAMDLTMNLVNVDAACAPLAGMAVYIWHCDAAGKYSLYELPDQNYLRGMQVADANGSVTFHSILPGTYRGRWPHVHFEVFRSTDAAVAGERALLTGQLAFAEDLVRAYYAGDDRYAASIPNLNQLTLTSDNVFGDSTPLQLAAQTVTPTRINAEALAVSAQIGLAGI